MSKAYVTLNGVNLMTRYGMNLVSYSIGTPAPVIKMIDVPGRPGGLDATLALNGMSNSPTIFFLVKYANALDTELDVILNGVVLIEVANNE